MFGEQSGDASKASKSQNASTAVWRITRVPGWNRFYLKKSSKTKVIFVDDRPSITDEQNDVLRECLDITLGPFKVPQHDAKLQMPWMKEPQKGNYFTCIKGVKYTPAMRILALADMGQWHTFGDKFLEDPRILDILRKPNVDKAAFAAVVGDTVADYAKEILTDATVEKCPLCELAWHSTGVDAAGKKIRPFGDTVWGANQMIFRSGIERVTFQRFDKKLKKSVEVVNPLKMIVANRADDASMFADKANTLNKIKTEKGLSGYEYNVSRGDGQTSPRLGTWEFALEEHTLAEIRALQPEAVFEINEVNVRNHLQAESGLRLALAMVRTGLDEDGIVKRVLATFPAGTLVPYPADYHAVLFPKTGDYLNKVFKSWLDVLYGVGKEPEPEVQPEPDAGFNDEEIPF